MKRTCKIALTVVATMTVVTGLRAATIVESPAILSDAMLSVSVPDLHGFIEEVGEVVAKVNPQMNGMMLKMVAGMQLGDPNLAGFAPGKGFSVIALDTTNIFAVVEVAEAQSAGYAALVGQKGMETTFTNGVLLVGSSAEVLKKATPLISSVQNTLLKKRTPTLRLAGQPSSMVDRNRAVIEQSMAMVPTLMSSSMMKSPGVNAEAMQTTVKVLQAEMHLFLSVAEQCEFGELVIAPDDGSVRIEEIVIPKAGTALASAMNAPKINKENPRIQAGLLGEGMVSVDMMLGNPKAFYDFIAVEMNKLVAEMKPENFDSAGFMAYIEKWTKLMNGSGAEIVDYDVDSGLSVSYLLDITDEEATLEKLKTLQTDIAPFMKLYADLGAPMDIGFKENVAEHNGIKLHQFTMGFDLEKMTKEQREQLESMKMDKMVYDLAVFDGLLVYAMGEGAIQNAIDRIKDSAVTITPLKARGVYPAGGFYYFDMDVGRYVDFVMTMMPDELDNPIMPQVVAMMQGVDPVTGAGFIDEGSLKISVTIPGDLIGKISQIGMMMQMQKQQQSVPTNVPVQ